MTSEEIEARKKRVSLKLGGVFIAATIWTVALPQIAPWVWPPLMITALVLVGGSVFVAYERVVLDKPMDKFSFFAPIVLAAVLTLTAVADGLLRQSYRLDDCMRFEIEMVTNPPGERAEAANAFEALRCIPSGGIVDRLWGPSHELEQDVKKARAYAKRSKEDRTLP